jgi:predicted DNA-binding protein
MEIQFKPETEARLRELENESGRPAQELIEDAMSAYLAEVAELRRVIDTRYDEVQSGRVKPIDGEEVLARLRSKSKQRRDAR